MKTNDPTVRRRPKWRLTHDRDFTWLVESESGDRVRMLRSCETLTETGSLVCGSMNSVRSLYEPFMAVIALANATAKTYEGRFSAVCRVCNVRTTWSIPLGSWLVVLSWLKNTAKGLEGLTSISWEQTYRKSGRATDRAFGAWAVGATPATTTVLRPSDSGG